MAGCKNLILVLGDQLTPALSSLAAGNKGTDIVLMVEVADEAGYVPHHVKKIAFIFSAMRHFAAELRESGWTVDYVMLDAQGNSGSFAGELDRACKRHAPDRVRVTEPGEWRVREALRGWGGDSGTPLEMLDDERFLASHEEFEAWASGRKQLRMEYFYREMRKKTGLLMEDGKPAGDKWNFDADNRKPPAEGMTFPERAGFAPDAVTRKVMQLVEREFPDNFGSLEPFDFPVTRADAEAARDHFVTEILPGFGDYQDAMVSGEPFMYHSLLSFCINIGLLDPLEVCRRAEAAWKDGKAPLNAVEGFIRQIIGWREYIRGIYWLKMPDYADSNFFDARRPLPAFYWSAETDMACVRAAVEQTRDHAYAHHIQRLMVTGTFALLAGIDPHAVHEWYLAVYADAYEWVELPNVIGMSQFADGGLLASKPYAASGAYINRMSDYCSGCRYKVSQKTGPAACPFNYLYWDFLDRHADKLATNARMRVIYKSWDNMDEDKREAVRQSAANFLARLD